MDQGEKIQEILSEIYNNTISEEVCPLLAFSELKKIEESVKQIKDEILELALEEREKYPEKELERHGFKISFAQSGKYSYKHIKEWIAKKKELTDIEDAAKGNLLAAQNGKAKTDKNGSMPEMAIYTSNKKSLKLTKSKK